MLDTNTVIFALRGPTEVLRRRLSEHTNSMAISTVSVSELFFGVARSSKPAHNQRAVREFLALLDVLAFDQEAAEHAGDIRASLAGSGQPIGGYDSLIAGHARSRGMAIVTNNVREFERVPRLLVVDWTLGSSPT
jgi:tRNA(fMet)-specific endonuclease VapC